MRALTGLPPRRSRSETIARVCPSCPGRTVQIPAGSKAEMQAGRGRPGFDVTRVSFLTTTVMETVVPSFAKEGWTRPREKCCEASFDRSGRGSCFKLPLIIPNGFDNR